jgi:phosphatidylglycerophosphatase A
MSATMNIDQFKKKRTPLPHSVWTNPLHFITCGFGLGAFPYFPGTIATIASIPIVIFLSHFSVYFYGLACLVLFLTGIYLCGKTNKDFKTDDHPATVFDEIATFPITMIGIPLNWKYLLIAFLLFRFFDIVKPWPISWADKNIHGGFGVMFDDVLAALASLIILHCMLYFF